MTNKAWKPADLLFLLFFPAAIVVLSGSIAADQATVTVTPREYANALRNPLLGFVSKNSAHPYATLWLDPFPWNAIENDESDGIDKIISFCNTRWATYPENNIKVIPRIYLEFRPGSNFWPADMTPGDYTSPQFKSRVERLIQRIGQVWDHDPRVAYVQMGIFGAWGEQACTALDDAAIQALVGDAFTAAFKEKLVLTRNPTRSFKNYRFGNHDDNYGSGNSWDVKIQNTVVTQNRWKTAVNGGEVAYNAGTPEFTGDSPTDSVSDPAHYNYITDRVFRLHCNFLSWIADYDYTNPATWTGANTIQKAMGYRFVITEAQYPKQVSPGGTLAFTFKVRNDGASIFHYNWPVEICLLDSSKSVVWKSTFKNLDIRTWYCGSNYDMTNHRYTAAAAISTVTDVFTIPNTVPPGVYDVAVAILDPSNMLPNARFAITNYYTGGRHPIGRIGIGKALSNAIIPESAFNDPQADKTIKYSATAAGGGVR